MDHFAGLDVSVKETSVCIVDDVGRIVREVKVARGCKSIRVAPRRLPLGVRHWSKVPPRQCCWQHRLFLRASAVSTSRTATRRSSSQNGLATSRAGMLAMRSIRRTPNGCGI
jgi:hypothetical protein